MSVVQCRACKRRFNAPQVPAQKNGAVPFMICKHCIGSGTEFLMQLALVHPELSPAINAIMKALQKDVDAVVANKAHLNITPIQDA